MYGVIYEPYARRGAGAADVSGAKVSVCRRNRGLFKTCLEVGKVGDRLAWTPAITASIHRRHQFPAVEALPDSEVERELHSVLKEGKVSPSEFLCAESDKPAVRRDGRKLVAESEAVREHDVCR